MKIKTLKNCPHIIKLEKLNLKQEVDGETNQKIPNVILDRLERTRAYKILYKVGKLKVVGFLVMPKKGKNLPCIIKLRGGSRDFAQITYQKLAYQHTFFADNGYVVISTQYPGVDGGDGEDDWGGEDTMTSIKQLKNILNWTPRANTKMIGVAGHSRGGLMAYMLLREVKWLKAAVIGGAPTDEFRAAKEREGWRDHQISLFGKSKQELSKRSPIKWAGELPKNVPMLIMHGSSDWRVPADHSILMSKELYDHKIPHKFILYEGADHGISEFWKDYRHQSLSWFNTYLVENRKLPNVKLHGF
jgi:dipeptidyl aminopeptidase/acylaminoacyl peptidase